MRTITCILLSGGLLVAMMLSNPDILYKLHGAVLMAGEYLPESVVTWMREFHSSDAKNAGEPFDWMKGPSSAPDLKLFTLEDIKYKEGGKLYLVMIGHVFDVTGAEFYKPGSGYHAFIGQDASRSFVTGEFSQDALTDDLEGLQPSDYTGLAGWLKFYLEHETYKFVGYLIGKYFDEHGKETDAMANVKKLLKWAAEESEKEEDLLKLFPSCNVEWKAATGSTVWCSTKSGGVDREWIGYPRKFFEKPEKSSRCACVHANYLADPRVKQYEGCSPTSDSCKILDKSDN